MMLWLRNKRNKIILLAAIGILLVGGLAFGIAIKKGWLLKPKAEVTEMGRITIRVHNVTDCKKVGDPSDGLARQNISMASVSTGANGAVVGPPVYRIVESCNGGADPITIVSVPRPVGNYYIYIDPLIGPINYQNMVRYALPVDVVPAKISSTSNNSIDINYFDYQPNLHGYIYSVQSDGTFESVPNAHLKFYNDSNLLLAELDANPSGYFETGAVLDWRGFKVTNSAYTHWTYSSGDLGDFSPFLGWPAVGIVGTLPAGPTSTKIFGHVYKKGTTEAIEGASIELYEKGSTTQLKTATSDANGYYSFTNLVSKDYTLVAKKDGYKDSDSKDVTMVQGQNEYEVNLELEPNNKTVLLTWDMPNDEMGSPQEYGFEIRRMDQGAGTCEDAEILWTIDPLEAGLDEAGSSAGMFYDSTAEKGKTYTYCIYAFTRLGDWSAPTTQDVEIPQD